MILRLCPLLIVLTILPATFIYVFCLRKSNSIWLRRLFFVPNLVLFVLTVFFAYNNDMLVNRPQTIAVYLVLLYSITVPETLYIVAVGIARIFKGRKARKSGNIIGIVLGIFAFILMGVSVASCYMVLRVNRHVYYSKKIPVAFDGYKIVHITDLHLGTFDFYPEALRNIVATVNNEKADLIAFTGDLVNFDRKEIFPYRCELAQLTARDGVVSVMGNHDYLMYVTDKENAENVAELQREQQKAGWKLLLNDKVVIHREKDSIVVIGSENEGGKSFPKRGNLKLAMQGVGKPAFKILLTHDPAQWREKVLPQTDIQLTLSGHTHAGQIKLLGHSASELVYKESDGMYYCGERAIIVSPGVGEALMPFRLGAWPAIDVITLKHKEH